VAKGWEVELRIALDTLVPAHPVLRLADEFLAREPGTRLRIAHEVLAGVWDALAEGRADLAIGASGEPPSGGGFVVRPLGRVELAFVAAPFHPACREPEPIDDDVIQKYRAVSIADTSRFLPPRSVGLLSGQDTLTVWSLDAKVAALAAGLGVGSIPRRVAEGEAASGRLRILARRDPPPIHDHVVAWRRGHEGKALKWFAKRLADPLVAAQLLS
jgi:DNA-binding transcriptional LysR family regulator